MYQVKILFLFALLMTDIAGAKDLKILEKNFNDIKMSLLALKINSKSADDGVFVRKTDDLNKAFDEINGVYWATPKEKMTVELINLVDSTATDLEFFKAAVQILKNKPTEENCSETWFTMQSLKKNNAILFEHFRAFLKGRCLAKFTPGIDDVPSTQ